MADADEDKAEDKDASSQAKPNNCSEILPQGAVKIDGSKACSKELRGGGCALPVLPAPRGPRPWAPRILEGFATQMVQDHQKVYLGLQGSRP